jgi:hypothetical protein
LPFASVTTRAWQWAKPTAVSPQTFLLGFAAAVAGTTSSSARSGTKERCIGAG